MKDLTKRHLALLGRAINWWTIAPRNGLINELLRRGLIEEMYFLGKVINPGSSVPLRRKTFLWRLSDAGAALLKARSTEVPSGEE